MQIQLKVATTELERLLPRSSRRFLAPGCTVCAAATRSRGTARSKDFRVGKRPSVLESPSLLSAARVIHVYL
ncbi:hypothetical protein NDU88_010518 [Pleurodeles waltl]|uniref:Uncharacterized protein n=1 Tax=Pleurodeles waltl TaxID=8319 RepID=A0AAV7PY60_PLEWA|nr:hypothetical protein NDU88_010518 [Pleurodeles waltl]